MRWLVVSLAVHALVVWLVVREEGVVRTEPRIETAERNETSELVVVLDDGISSGEVAGGGASGGAGGGGSANAPTSPTNASSTSATTVHLRTNASSTSAMTAHVTTNASSTSAMTAHVTTNASTQSRAARPQMRSADPWNGVSIRNEVTDDMRGGGGGTGYGNGKGNGNGNGNGNGDGNGNGNGVGNGIGFGNGGGVQAARDVPAPPGPPPVSKARPAKLIWPNRDLDVEDESYLFVAKVTVDEEGSVVGARMTTSRPGSRGEHAANAIWTFRYAPALDDAGKPIRSTLEQPFQVR